MKKYLIIAILAFLNSSKTYAQVTFKPGIRLGINISNFTKGSFDINGYFDANGNYLYKDTYSSKTDLYMAVYGALRLTKFYTLQPEICYSNQGSVVKKYNQYNGYYDSKLNISYLSLGVVNKFTINKLNIHIGPTIDFVVNENFNSDSDLDFAFLLGVGYNLTSNFGIEARIKKGIVPVLDYSSSNHTNQVFQLGATYTFDLK